MDENFNHKVYLKEKKVNAEERKIEAKKYLQGHHGLKRDNIANILEEHDLFRERIIGLPRYVVWLGYRIKEEGLKLSELYKSESISFEKQNVELISKTYIEVQEHTYRRRYQLLLLISCFPAGISIERLKSITGKDITSDIEELTECFLL